MIQFKQLSQTTTMQTYDAPKGTFDTYLRTLCEELQTSFPLLAECLIWEEADNFDSNINRLSTLVNSILQGNPSHSSAILSQIFRASRLADEACLPERIHPAFSRTLIDPSCGIDVLLDQAMQSPSPKIHLPFCGHGAGLFPLIELLQQKYPDKEIKIECSDVDAKYVKKANELLQQKYVAPEERKNKKYKHILGNVTVMFAVADLKTTELTKADLVLGIHPQVIDTIEGKKIPNLSWKGIIQNCLQKNQSAVFFTFNKNETAFVKRFAQDPNTSLTSKENPHGVISFYNAVGEKANPARDRIRFFGNIIICQKPG